MDVYAETILDHYRHPRAKKELDSPTVSHGEVNHSCGDMLTIELLIEAGKIMEIGWSGEGCAISQAGMSLLAEELIGKTTVEAASLTQQQIYDLIGVPIGPRRFKCALLCLHTLKNTIRKADGLEVQSWLDTVKLTEE